MSTIEDLLFQVTARGKAKAHRIVANDAALPGAVRGIALAMLAGGLVWAALLAVVLS